ncbi:2,3-bisphosphoglycerate-independent phosphoglycerate mutase [Candidatus Peregrinibacteria bacterium]|nr:2,3-bisphosphoglycerate-independent phosphoglycerate mutase [Candidatus Peregrinibacteria bacterium]
MENKVLLMILDGYGEGKAYKGNAVKLAKSPNINALRKKYPKCLLDTSGNAVGLPKGSQGGSEVGHFTIGAGRIVWQSLEEINRSIKNKSFFKKKAFLNAVKNVKKHNSKLHLIGMISDQGVHSDFNHLFALLKLAKQNKIKKVYIHAFTDGRDVPERSSDVFFKKIASEIKKIGVGTLSTMVGRYYAMDRDRNWKRTEKAYDLLTLAKGINEKNPIEALKKQYQKGVESDYYIKPVVFDENGVIEEKDSVIFFNYRSDRAQQITEAFTNKKFTGFKRKKTILPFFVCFGPYSKIAPVVFEPPKINLNLGKYISKQKLPQLRIAETEKYAHVTFFFNSQEKDPYPLENRILIPSKKCPSYAQKPEMSAREITSALLKEFKNKEYKLIVLNFANGDLVGHSGDLKATIKAVETLDKCIGKIIPVAKKLGYHILLTADHGNAEYKIYEKTGEECPSHTLNPVIFILISDKYKNARLKKRGGLCDIAPTILDILGMKKPKEMTGKSLIIKKIA